MYSFASVQQEVLPNNNDRVIHQVLRLLHIYGTPDKPTSSVCHTATLCLFINTLADDWTHGGIPTMPILHVSDAVSQTLWHMRMCHPNPERLGLLSNISKGVPQLKHPHTLKKCSDCPIAKMRKAAGGRAFYFYLRSHAVLPHGTNIISPYHNALGHPVNFSRLHTFGCHIYDLSNKRRNGKLTT
jgi:hypothetical protein